MTEARLATRTSPAAARGSGSCSTRSWPDFRLWTTCCTLSFLCGVPIDELTRPQFNRQNRPLEHIEILLASLAEFPDPFEALVIEPAALPDDRLAGQLL